MAYFAERYVVTKGQDENLVAKVVFPCNMEDLLDQMKVSNSNDIIFLNPQDRYSVELFNDIVKDADARIEKIKEQINASVRSLYKRMERYSDEEKSSNSFVDLLDSIPLNVADRVLWECFMPDYRHPDDKVSVNFCGNELFVLLSK